MQVGRSLVTVIALRRRRAGRRRNFARILAWCVVSGALALGGGFAHGSRPGPALGRARSAVDLRGRRRSASTRPGLRPVPTPADWTIEGGHFAERCQAFVLIALGESIVLIGATLAGQKSATAASVTGFVVAFAGSVALWWLYFDQSAEAAAEKIARSDDPGRLGRSAYHFITR